MHVRMCIDCITILRGKIPIGNASIESSVYAKYKYRLIQLFLNKLL